MSTREVIAYAKRNGGVFTTGEALDLGMPQTTLSRRVSDGVFVRVTRGVFVRVTRGVFSLPGTSTRPDVMMRAAGRLMGAVVSHVTAGEMHGLEPVPQAPPTVTVMHRRTYTFPGLTVHQSTDLLPEHVMTLKGLTVTRAPRTIVDLASMFKKKRMEHIVDNALAASIVDFDELVDMYLALTRQGKKGMRILGRILRERAEGQFVSATVLERRLLALLIAAGLPAPQREFHAPWLEPINGRVDFAYLPERIVIEADSRRWHGLFDAIETDRRRDIAAQLAGWIVFRITWKMITEDPEFVVDSVRSALELRRATFSK